MVIVIGMWGEPLAAEAGVTLHRPEACRVFSWGSRPWITGPWPYWAAQAPRCGGVGSDLCLHTGFLVAVAAALEFFLPVSGVRADSCGLHPSLELA